MSEACRHPRATVMAGRVMAPLVLILCSVAATVPAEPAAAAAPLKALVAQPADITQVYGSGFRLELARPLPKSLYKSGTFTISGVRYTMAGFTGGYGATYIRTSALLHHTGVGSVTSTVGAYTSASSPRDQMQQLLSHLDRLPQAAKKYLTNVKVATLSGVGNEALLETYQSKQSKPSYGVLILFRRDHYTETLIVSSSNTPEMAPAIRLARIVDARIRHGG